MSILGDDKVLWDGQRRFEGSSDRQEFKALFFIPKKSQYFGFSRVCPKQFLCFSFLFSLIWSAKTFLNANERDLCFMLTCLAHKAQIMGRMQSNQSKQAVYPDCAFPGTNWKATIQIHPPWRKAGPRANSVSAFRVCQRLPQKNKHHVIFRRTLTALYLVKWNFTTAQPVLQSASTRFWTGRFHSPFWH